MIVYSKRKVNSDTQMGIILVATIPLIVTLPLFVIITHANLPIFYAASLAFLAILIIPYRKINRLREGVKTFVIFYAIIYGWAPLGVEILNFLTGGLDGIFYLIHFFMIIVVSLIVASGIGLRVRRLSKKWNMQINENQG